MKQERPIEEIEVESYFGLSDNVTENTPISTDYGQIVNLLTMFREKHLAASPSPSKDSLHHNDESKPKEEIVSPSPLQEHVEGISTSKERVEKEGESTQEALKAEEAKKPDQETLIELRRQLEHHLSGDVVEDLFDNIKDEVLSPLQIGMEEAKQEAATHAITIKEIYSELSDLRSRLQDNEAPKDIKEKVNNIFTRLYENYQLGTEWDVAKNTIEELISSLQRKREESGEVIWNLQKENRNLMVTNQLIFNKADSIMDDLRSQLQAAQEEVKKEREIALRLSEQNHLQRETIKQLTEENEALLKGLKGKHSLTGATYAAIIEQRDRLKQQLTDQLSNQASACEELLKSRDRKIEQLTEERDSTIRSYNKLSAQLATLQQSSVDKEKNLAACPECGSSIYSTVYGMGVATNEVTPQYIQFHYYSCSHNPVNKKKDEAGTPLT